MRKVPGYCKHKAKNKGYARFGQGSKPVYFPGLYDSVESRAAYHVALAEYLSGARPGGVVAGERLTVRQLMAAWWKECERRYVKFGQPTNELSCQRSALRFARELYADLLAANFGPAQLMAVRQKMIEAGWVRSNINVNVSRVRMMFKWAASQGLVPIATHTALTTVSALCKGKCAARESVPKSPPTVWQLRAALEHSNAVVAAMIRLQYVTGMRPGEVLSLRPCDLDRSQEPWQYVVRPEAAKTGNEVYWLGPRARQILAPWLLKTPADDARVFRYSADGYRCHIKVACRTGGQATFGPHQLRHARAARVADVYGDEGAAKALNHTQVTTTRRYSRTSTALARRIASETG